MNSTNSLIEDCIYKDLQVLCESYSEFHSSVSYWYKKGTFGLTYGADALFLTDFKKLNFGIAPVVGFRF